MTIPAGKNYIEGAFVDGGAGSIDVLDPSTGAVVGQQALANASDIDIAVRAAADCHSRGDLTKVRPVERGRMVRRMGDFFLNNRDEIARVLTTESGKPLWESKLEVTGTARYFEYYGSQAETLEGRSIPLGENYFDFTVYEPFGVSAHIIPWNFPLEMAARSLAAALATGNACIVKTPELDPLSSHFLALAAEAADAPAGSVNILCGLGNEAGAALSSHPDVSQIVFTGSQRTGISIAESAARNIVPCVLELGGKSAAVVFSDADVDQVVENIRWGIFVNAGQVCSALSRLVVHQSIHDEVVDRVCELAESLQVGPGMQQPEFGNSMGAMISKSQRDRAVSMCRAAASAGAKIATGGHACDRPGFFMEPTVLTNVSSSSEMARTEVFGPVLSVFSFESDAEAFELANNSDYGLVGGVFTQNIDRAMQFARGMRVGQIYINEWYAGGVETPFGGFGKSGYGREKGREALLNYVQTKNIAIRLTSSPS